MLGTETLLLVEPNPGDGLEDQREPARADLLRPVHGHLHAGFSHVRRATDTPFNLILEARA